MQTNRINGEAAIDLTQAREPARRIGLRRGGTPNHKMEAAAVEVGYHCLLDPNEEGTPATCSARSGRIRHYFTLSKDRQDTAAGPLTRLVLAEEGGFGANLRRGRLPKLIAPCIAELFEEGHHIYFPEGLPDSDKFSAPDCWIEYDSGRFSFAGEPKPLRGAPVRIVRRA